MLEKNDGKLDNHLLWEQSKKEGAFEKTATHRVRIWLLFLQFSAKLLKKKLVNAV